MTRRVKMMNKRGQTALPEYVLILFVVIAFAVAITVYTQRALQARVFDARNYAIKQAQEECKSQQEGDGVTDCKGALLGGGITREYEPYYGQIISNTDRRRVDHSGIEGGVAKIEGIYRKSIDESTVTTTESHQRPPRDAN